MADNNQNTTVKFRADITDLKASLQEASRQARLVNSEFAAASAGLGKWSASTDGLNAKLKQLNQQEQIQQRVLSALEEEYKRVAEAEGEGSKGAEELRIRINNQQAAINKTQSDIEHYTDKLKDLKEAGEKAGDLSALDKQKEKISALESELTQAKSKYAALQLEEKDTTEESEKLAKEINDLSKELKDAKDDLGKAEKAADQFDDSLEKVDDQTSKTGDGFTVMKGVLADLVASGIKLAVNGLKEMAQAAKEAYQEFDNGEDNVIKATGATGAAAKELKESYKNVATSVRGEFDELGSALGEVNTRFGFTGEQLEDATVRFQKFSEITGTDATSAVQLVSRAMGDAGIDAEDYADLLDDLALAAQASGISVDTLAESITKYGAPLRAVGFSTKESIALFSQWEKAGVNTEIAMSGMKKAISNWGNENKDAREEFKKTLDEIAACPDIASATTKAIEIFGAKAGPDLADAIKGGRFAYEDFLKLLEGSQGTVEKTYEETEDGFDKIQLAIQKAKAEVGEYVGELLTRYQPQIEQMIEVIFAKGKDAVEWVIDHGEMLIKLFGAIGTAMGVAFAVNKISTFAQSITGIIGVFKSLTTATQVATGAQEALNVAQTATPWGAIALGITGAVVGLIALAEAFEKANAYTDDNIKNTKEMSEEYERLNGTLERNKETREEAYSNTEAEAKQAEILADKLDELAGKENKSNAEKELMKQYVEKLNELIPDLNLQYDEEADKLSKSTDAIHENIAAQKELALAKAAQENLSKIAEDMAEAEIAYGEAVKQNEENEKRLAAAKRERDKAYQESQGSGPEATAAYDQYVKLQEKVQAYQQAVNESQTAVEGYQQKIQQLNTEYDNTANYAQNMIDRQQIRDALGALVDEATAAGVEIPQAVKDGITAGSYALPESVEAMKALITYDSMATDAQNAGLTIPASIADGISSGSLDPATAVEQMNGLVSFASLLDEAGIAGSKVPSYITEGIVSGQMEPADAVTQTMAFIDYQDALREAAEAGVDIPAELTAGIQSGEKDPADAAAKLRELVNAETAKGGGNAKKDGEDVSKQYGKGIEDKAHVSRTAASYVAERAQRQLDKGSEGSRTSGRNFTQGFINGISSLIMGVGYAAFAIGRRAINKLREAQQEGSPSKLTAQSGRYFVQGYINGIASQEKSLVKTVQSLVKKTIKTLTEAEGYDFTATGNKAASILTKNLTPDLTYMMNKATYNNQKQLARFDTTIADLEATRDRIVNAFNDNANRAKDDKGKNYWQKKVKEEQAKYEKLINTQKKYKEAYQAASQQMLTQFQSAINSYQQAAQDLINDTINGITQKYTERYNELISKQETLVSKLKGFGDIFSVSGAGIGYVNDLKEQTKQITEYTTKLGKIKEKVSAELFDEITQLDVKEGSAFMDRLLNLSRDDLQAYNDAYTAKMKAAADAASLYSNELKAVSKDYEAEIEEAFKGIPKQMETLGDQAMKGFMDGLTKNTDYMDSNVKTFVSSMITAFKKELKIKSPSRVMMEIGDYTGAGFVEGIKGTIADVKSAVSDIAGVVASPLEVGKISGIAAAGRTGSVTETNIVNNYNLVQNNNSPKSLSALETYQARRQQIAMIKALT